MQYIGALCTIRMKLRGGLRFRLYLSIYLNNFHEKNLDGQFTIFIVKI